VSDRAWTRTEPRWSQGELIELIRQDAGDGIAPSITRWRRDPNRPSPSSVERLFGSWSRLCEAAGLQMSRRPARRAVSVRSWSRAAILAQLKADAVDGVAPAARDWREDPARPPGFMVEREFGSWGEAVTAAGLRTRRQVKRARAEQRAAEQTEGPQSKRRRAARDEAREEFERQLQARENGLTVRQMTDDDRVAFEAARKRRRSSPEPTNERSNTWSRTEATR
jgi:hypothetical protein